MSKTEDVTSTDHYFDPMNRASIVSSDRCTDQLNEINVERHSEIREKEKVRRRRMLGMQ